MEDVALVSDNCPKQARQHRWPGPEQQEQRVAGIRYASVYLSTAQCELGHDLKESPTKKEMRTLTRQQRRFIHAMQQLRAEAVAVKDPQGAYRGGTQRDRTSSR